MDSTALPNETLAPVMSPRLEAQLRDLLENGGHNRIELIVVRGRVTTIQLPFDRAGATERIEELERALAHARGIADAERRRAQLLDDRQGIAWRATMGPVQTR